ncbi:MAG: AraC family transcriptional regulator [Eubacteriales bacterium]|nr:AraC family transcriptional regulator [Eubacteriales bacterium]
MTELLSLFFSSTNLPVTLFTENLLEDKYSPFHQDFNLPLLLFSSLPEEKPGIWYSYTPEFLYFAGISLPDSDQTLLIGPLLLTECTNRQALSVTQRLGRKLEDMYTLQQYFNCIQPHSVSGLKSSLKLLCYLLKLPMPEDIPLISFTWNLPYQTGKYTIETLEDDTSNFDLENRILSCIRHGDLASIRRLFSEEILPIGGGTQRDLPKIRTFISNANMLASRISIQNGVEYSRASAVNNRYYMEIQAAANLAELSECFFSYIQEYTRMNAELYDIKSDSILVRKITQYTKSHITESLSTRIFAEQLGMNASYLSSHFKKETGMTISAYIQQEKIREAKKLLEGSPLTISDISAMLDFTNESYFCSIFKKRTGMTPESYRKHYVAL